MIIAGARKTGLSRVTTEKRRASTIQSPAIQSPIIPQLQSMTLSALSMLLVAIALVLHTIEEAWLPEYQRVKPDWRAAVFNRALWLDNFPIFMFAIALGVVGWQIPLLSGILPAIGLTHPVLDHVGLSWRYGHFRAGGWTGVFLLFPLSIWAYGVGQFQPYEAVISGAIGLGISIFLVWTVEQERKAMAKDHR